jgi:hypothetical protein
VNDDRRDRLWSAVVAEFATRPPAVREAFEAACRAGRVGFEAGPSGPGRVTAGLWLDGRLIFEGEAPIDESEGETHA